MKHFSILCAAALLPLIGCDKDGPVEPVTPAPVITDITPLSAVAGTAITIRGQNFGEFKHWNDVWVGGLRAEILSAGTTELRVVLPQCLPSRAVDVQVTRGILESGIKKMQVTAISDAAMTLQPGEARTFVDASAVSCVRLGAEAQNASYVVMATNAAIEAAPGAKLELVLLAEGANLPAVAVGRNSARSYAARTDATAAWHHALRERESAMVMRAQQHDGLKMDVNLRVSVPAIGERRSFNVLNRSNQLAKVTAGVIAVGRTVAVYADLELAGAVSAEDVQSMIATFDDLIYPVETSIFGRVPDVDRSGRVAILITPGVNRLSEPGSTSYVAGFFFGCDLLDLIDCSASNIGEILYAAAPDPDARFGPKLSKQRALAVLPSVMAHEFEHLIHFNERILIGKSRELEAMWLTEALALFAEDTIGGILYNRGDHAAADEYLFYNRHSAGMYLKNPQSTALVATDGGGTTEERGAGWLFLRYLQSRFGSDIFARFVRATTTGSATVTAVTGGSWPQLVRDWGTALYVAGADNARFSALPNYGSFNVRAAVSSAMEDGLYPLTPLRSSKVDAKHSLSLPASGIAYYEIETPAGTGIHLMLTGQAGAAIATTAAPALTIVRTK